MEIKMDTAKFKVDRLINTLKKGLCSHIKNVMPINGYRVNESI